MKFVQKISAITLPAATYLSLAIPALAAPIDVNPCEAGNTGDVKTNLCKFSGDSIGQYIANAVTIILVVAAVIALFFLIWGGIKWILSGGDKGKVEAARGTIIAAIVGLIIAFLAFFILNIVLGIFGLSLGQLELPALTD